MAWPGARPTYASLAAAAAAPLPVVAPASLCAGYGVRIDAPAIAATWPDRPVAQRVDVGTFAPGLPVPADVLAKKHQVTYVPPNTPDSIAHPADPSSHVGAFTIGRSAIGHRRAFHGRVTLSNSPGGGETETPR